MVDSNDVVISLQDDFNRGMPIDTTEYAEALNYLSAMGFVGNAALEAVIVTDNAGAEAALQYLLAEPSAQKSQRIQTQLDRGMALMDLQQGFDLCREVQNARNRVRKAYLERAKHEELLESDGSRQKLCRYREFLRAVLANRTLNEKKLLSIEHHKKTESISDKEHEEALKELGFTLTKFEEMKSNSTGSTTEIRDCNSCWDAKKCHVALECMHVTLCEGCADIENSKKPLKCPMCSIGVREFLRVFY